MLVIWLAQGLFGAAALAFCALTCHAVLRRDAHAPLWLTLAGSLSLVFFVSVPKLPAQMIGISLVAIAAGVLMSPRNERTVALDSTASRKR